MKKIKVSIESILTDEYNSLSKEIRKTINDITFLKYLIKNNFSNKTGDDNIELSDIIRLRDILFDNNTNKAEQDHLLLPTVLLIMNSKLDEKTSQSLESIKKIINNKIDNLNNKLDKMIKKINNIYNLINNINNSDTSEITEIIKDSDIDDELINKILLEITEYKAIYYRLNMNTDKKYLKKQELVKLFNIYGFNFSLLDTSDQEILINNSDLNSIEKNLIAIDTNKLEFFKSLKADKYEYSSELVQILLLSNNNIINNVCESYLSCGGVISNLSNILPAFLDNKEKDNYENKKAITVNDKKILLAQKQGNLSKRYQNFVWNLSLLTDNITSEIISEIINYDSNILIMNSEKLKSKLNIFKQYNIQIKSNQIKTFIKLLYTMSSMQIVNILDKYIELGFDPINELSYKKTIEDNISKLLFSYAVDKIYYAKAHGIQVYNSKNNWYSYILNNKGNNLNLDDVRKEIPHCVEDYYSFMKNIGNPISDYYDILNNIKDDEFNKINYFDNNDIVQKIIDLFEQFVFDDNDEYYYFASCQKYISKPKFIRNLKILENKIDNYNFIDIVLLCITNNSILTEEEFKSLSATIDQILDNKKKVL